MSSDIVGTKHRLIKGIHLKRKTLIYPINIQNMVQLPNEGPPLVSNIAIGQLRYLYYSSLVDPM